MQMFGSTRGRYQSEKSIVQVRKNPVGQWSTIGNFFLAKQNYRLWWEFLPSRPLKERPCSQDAGCLICRGCQDGDNGPRHYSKTDIRSKLDPLETELRLLQNKKYKGADIK